MAENHQHARNRFADHRFRYRQRPGRYRLPSVPDRRRDLPRPDRSLGPGVGVAGLGWVELAVRLRHREPEPAVMDQPAGSVQPGRLHLYPSAHPGWVVGRRLQRRHQWRGDDQRRDRPTVDVPQCELHRPGGDRHRRLRSAVLRSRADAERVRRRQRPHRRLGAGRVRRHRAHRRGHVRLRRPLRTARQDLLPRCRAVEPERPGDESGAVAGSGLHQRGNELPQRRRSGPRRESPAVGHVRLQRRRDRADERRPGQLDG